MFDAFELPHDTNSTVIDILIDLKSGISMSHDTMFSLYKKKGGRFLVSFLQKKSSHMNVGSSINKKKFDFISNPQGVTVGQ